jgi:hypothetical protein
MDDLPQRVPERDTACKERGSRAIIARPLPDVQLGRTGGQGYYLKCFATRPDWIIEEP